MKQNITVVSLGPGDPELLTAQSLNTMKKAKRLIFRTAQHPVQLSGLAAHHAPGAPPVPVGS